MIHYSALQKAVLYLGAVAIAAIACSGNTSGSYTGRANLIGTLRFYEGRPVHSANIFFTEKSSGTAFSLIDIDGSCSIENIVAVSEKSIAEKKDITFKAKPMNDGFLELESCPVLQPNR
ncbi:hypothetical protein HYU18_02540 [Candidatus Woesearchaeota archaeon]|nr:hypothetical protein [Candidatus Woesearchaeota archaeon]